MSITPEQLDEIIESLRGTCDSLDNQLEQRNLNADDLTMEYHYQIDEQIFNCSTCGWWCERCDLSTKSEECETHELTCRECDPDEEE